MRKNYWVIPGLGRNVQTISLFNASTAYEGAKRIRNMVASLYGYTIKELVSKRRDGERVKVRQVAMYLIYQKYGNDITLARIGHLFMRDHTTVMHARKTIMNLCDTEPPFELEVRTIEKKINTYLESF